MGFTLPLSKNGTPKTFSFPAHNANSILEYLDESEKSSYLYVMMAEVLESTVKVPPFCLAAWGTNNRFTAVDVYCRTKFVLNELQKYDINVLGFSSDGDTRLLKAQRFLTGLGKTNHPSVPYIFKDFFFAKMDVVIFSIQDVLHLINKLKNRMLKSSFPLVIGKTIIPVMRDLEILIEKVPRGVHGLSLSDLDTTDKMNATKALKISQERVEVALKNLSKTETEATRLYLRVMRYAYESISRTDLSVADRLGMTWYATFILRGWKRSNSANEFVSPNVYQCQELNCHNLTAMIRSLRNDERADIFCPEKFQSQTCERTFRRLRSFTTTEITVTNFDTKDALSRLHRIALMEESESFLRENGFVFPRDMKTECQNALSPVLPSDEQIVDIMKKARTKALNHLKHFGVENNDEVLPCLVNLIDNLEDENETVENRDEQDFENIDDENEQEQERNESENDRVISLCEGIAQNANDSTITSKITNF